MVMCDDNVWWSCVVVMLSYLYIFSLRSDEIHYSGQFKMKLPAQFKMKLPASFILAAGQDTVQYSMIQYASVNRYRSELKFTNLALLFQPCWLSTAQHGKLRIQVYPYSWHEIIAMNNLKLKWQLLHLVGNT